MSVLKVSGKKEAYSGVGITYVKGGALTISSPNGRDKLVVSSAACYYVGQLKRCLITKISFNKDGAMKAMTLKSGSIYVNPTLAKQQMPLSSQQLPPNGILLALQTQIGTYINVEGVIDGPLIGDKK